jgi:hypothetical protein
VGKVGLKIEWREYAGADQGGHWLGEPEEFDDIVRFLESIPDSDQDLGDEVKPCPRPPSTIPIMSYNFHKYSQAAPKPR